jgi:hypothetical protein
MPSLRRSPQMTSASVSFGATVRRTASSTRPSLRGRRLFSVRSRAHSSAGERPLHTREVPGSIPGAPIRRNRCSCVGCVYVWARRRSSFYFRATEGPFTRNEGSPVRVRASAPLNHPIRGDSSAIGTMGLCPIGVPGRQEADGLSTPVAAAPRDFVAVRQ